LLALLRQGPAVKLVSDVIEQSDEFFATVENVCEELAQQQRESQRLRTSPSMNEVRSAYPDKAAHGRNCGFVALTWFRTLSPFPSSAFAKPSRTYPDVRGQGDRAGADGVQSSSG
jgi:hypothetical protein